MTKQTLKNFALALGLLGLALIPSTSVAQAGLASKFPGKNPATAAAQAANQQAETPGAPSYTYTLLNFPGTLSTVAEGMNLGATTSKTEVVGGYGPYGFLYQSGTYTTINYPGNNSENELSGINDSGVIVGAYGSVTQYEHAFIYENGQFTDADVPFGPPALIYAAQISNKGVIVGMYIDTSETYYGYEATIAP